MTILDFCTSCGSLLPPGEGLTENPKCPNCGSDIRPREQRCQGTFSPQDADKMLDAYDYA